MTFKPPEFDVYLTNGEVGSLVHTIHRAIDNAPPDLRIPLGAFAGVEAISAGDIIVSERGTLRIAEKVWRRYGTHGEHKVALVAIPYPAFDPPKEKKT